MLVKDFRLNDDKTQPNLEGAMSDSMRFARRFIVLDTLTGSSGSDLKYVRWANSIQIKIELDPSAPEQIFRPYVVVSYKEEQRSSIDASSTSAVTYSLEYFSSFDPTMRRATVAFVIMNILAFVVIGVRFYNYTARNPKSAMKHEAVKN